MKIPVSGKGVCNTPLHHHGIHRFRVIPLLPSIALSPLLSDLHFSPKQRRFCLPHVGLMLWESLYVSISPQKPTLLAFDTLAVRVCAFVCLLCATAHAMGKHTAAHVARLKIADLPNNRPRAVSTLLLRLTERTSIKIGLDVPDLTPQDPRLFRFPMLILTGAKGFSPLPTQDILRLRAYLSNGGLLWIDRSEDDKDSDFDKSARRLAKRIFSPNNHEKALVIVHGIEDGGAVVEGDAFDMFICEGHVRQRRIK